MFKRFVFFSCVAAIVSAITMVGMPPTAAADSPLLLQSKDGDYGLLFNLQYRPRFEYNGNQDFVKGTDHRFISHRARLSVAGTYKDFMEIVFQVQDVRYWGEERAPTGLPPDGTLFGDDATGFDLHQGYVVLKHEDKCAAKVGRQELLFDGQRLIGNVNWAQSARSFDAIRAGYQQQGSFGFTGVYAKLVEEDQLQDSSYDRNLGILHGSVDLTESILSSLIVIWDGDKDDDLNRWTVGPYLSAKSGGLHGTLEGYGQFGSRETDTPYSLGKADYLAYMVGGRAGYTMDDISWTPTVDIWFDYLSGDDNPNDDKIKVFDTLFATNHKYYGFMDMFLNIPLHTGGLGLMDGGVMVKVRPHEHFICRLDYHYFRTARDTANNNNYLGSEIDFTMKIPLPAGVVLSSGISVFFRGDAMKDLKASSDQSTEEFGFVMLDVKI